LVVHPDHRKKGVGKMLVQWGLERADALGVETVVQSVPFSVPFYEKCGFACVEQIDIDFSVSEPSEQWKRYQNEDMRAFFMWRPAGKDYEMGDSMPWKET
jgi:predicted N-acetyltransferase YhbS